MPKLYEYLGLIVLFYSNEHKPIHVHGKYQDRESKAEILFKEGKFWKVRIVDVKGKKPLDSKNKKKLQKLAETYRDDIVRKWVDFFVYNRKVQTEIITKKIN